MAFMGKYCTYNNQTSYDSKFSHFFMLMDFKGFSYKNYFWVSITIIIIFDLFWEWSKS